MYSSVQFTQLVPLKCFRLTEITELHLLIRKKLTAKTILHSVLHAVKPDYSPKDCCIPKINTVKQISLMYFVCLLCVSTREVLNGVVNTYGDVEMVN